MLIAEPDGSLVVALRGLGPEPAAPQRLVTLGPDRDIASEVTLADLPPDANWMKAALSADGTRIAATRLNGPISVIDRATGSEVASVDVLSAGFVGFDGPDRLLVDRGAGSFERPLSGVAQVYALPDATQVGEASGAAAAPIFTNGIAAAISTDGTLIAQHVETARDSGVVAIRIADAAFPSWSGRLLTAPLAAWRLGRQILPELSFSPDGRYLAASFDSPQEWGRTTSAVIVWSLATDEVVASIPTTTEWRSIAWLPDGESLAVLRFHADAGTGEVAVIGL
ncbi:MAG: hypothetical protein AB7O56_02870 [Bauldia sp.]